MTSYLAHGEKHIVDASSKDRITFTSATSVVLDGITEETVLTIEEVKCPTCGSTDVKPARSEGMICRKCGAWF